MASAGQRSEIAVGRAPSGFPPDFLPTTTTAVLGGVAVPRDETAAGGQRPEGASAVVAMPQAVPEAVAAYAAQLERFGWRRASEVDVRGGFVPSPPARVRLCGDSAWISAYGYPRAVGGSLLHLDLRWDRFGGGPCGPGRDAARYMIYVPMPELKAPEGAVTLDAERRGATGYAQSTVRLETRLGPAELAAHYAAQLRRAGWTLGAQSRGDGVAALTADRRQADGPAFRGVLVATALPGANDREVLFRVTWPADWGR